MTQEDPTGPLSPLTLVEQEVLQALKNLPNGFSVNSGKLRQISSALADKSLNYTPDFVITEPEGRQIFVEVKSSNSLSMMNLSRLLPISENVRAAGQGFLLLVSGDARDRVSKAGKLKEFRNLHIRSAGSPGEVIKSVLEEFQEMRDSA